MTEPGIVHHPVAESAIRTARRAGQRAHGVHARFSEGTVQLAFGRHAATDRVLHVSEADRGRACGCHCPACSEELVARQGEELAWHFAHASGAACRDAVSASIAAWFLQVLQDGAPLVLPPVSMPWGLSTRVLPGPSAPVVCRPLRCEQEAPGAAFAVRVEVETATGSVPLRIFPCAVPNPVLPTVEGCRVEDVATVVLDLLDALRTHTSSDGGMDATWLTGQLLGEAPRRWLWSPKSDRARARLEEERLGAWRRALAAPMPRSRDLGAVFDALEASGLDRALAVAPGLAGEAFFAAGPRDWRAMFLHDMLLLPAAGLKPGADSAGAGFSSRELGAWLRTRRLDRVPYAATKDWTLDDKIEAGRAHPLWRPAFPVVQEWVFALWRAGFLAAKPWKDTMKGADKGPLDPSLAGRDRPFWRPSDLVLAAARTYSVRRTV